MSAEQKMRGEPCEPHAEIDDASKTYYINEKDY